MDAIIEEAIEEFDYYCADVVCEEFADFDELFQTIFEDNFDDIKEFAKTHENFVFDFNVDGLREACYSQGIYCLSNLLTDEEFDNLVESDYSPEFLLLIYCRFCEFEIISPNSVGFFTDKILLFKRCVDYYNKVS